MCNNNEDNTQAPDATAPKLTLPDNLTQTPSPEVIYETFTLKEKNHTGNNSSEK